MTRSPGNTSSVGRLHVNEVFRAILIRADLPDAQLFAAHEVARWPEGALDWLMRAGILREAEPAEDVLCEECEEGCWIKPNIREDPQTHQRVGTYFCHRNEDIGRFKVDLSRKRQWKFILVGLAKAVSKAVKPTGKVVELAPERLVLLGIVKLDGKNRELFLARGAAWPDAQAVFGGAVRLKTASHPVILTLVGMPLSDLLPGVKTAVRPLVEIARFDKNKLTVPLDGAFPEVEPGPWADLANEPITLDQFMVKFCEEHKGTYIAARRRGLLAADRNETLKLPQHVEPWTSGQAKTYFTHDLLDAWESYVDRRLVPPLLAQYRTKVL